MMKRHVFGQQNSKLIAKDVGIKGESVTHWYVLNIPQSGKGVFFVVGAILFCDKMVRSRI